METIELDAIEDKIAEYIKTKTAKDVDVNVLKGLNQNNQMHRMIGSMNIARASELYSKILHEESQSDKE